MIRSCSPRARSASCTASSTAWWTTMARRSTRSRSGSSSSSGWCSDRRSATRCARSFWVSRPTSRRCAAVVLPQRDAIARLARREFPQISETMSYRFRDVYDHLVRLTDEALFLQDRVTGLLDAYLSTQSNRLNQVMKVLTVISTIFMPLTVLTGMFGMNVDLPQFPGGDAGAVLVDRRHHGRDVPARCCGCSAGWTGCEPHSPAAAGRWPTRSPPARSSSGRRRSSRNWSRTPSTPVRRRIDDPRSSSAARS